MLHRYADFQIELKRDKGIRYARDEMLKKEFNFPYRCEECVRVPYRQFVDSSKSSLCTYIAAQIWMNESPQHGGDKT